MCYIVFISHSLHWRYIKIALQEYVIKHFIRAGNTQFPFDDVIITMIKRFVALAFGKIFVSQIAKLCCWFHGSSFKGCSIVFPAP